MAHFAEIGNDNIVKRVIVIHNNECLDADGNESEAVGAAYCSSLLGGTWVQTSYNGSIRKNYAGEGFTYNLTLDAFIAPQPEGNGWILDEETCRWRNPELEAA